MMQKNYLLKKTESRKGEGRKNIAEDRTRASLSTEAMEVSMGPSPANDPEAQREHARWRTEKKGGGARGFTSRSDYWSKTGVAFLKQDLTSECPKRGVHVMGLCTWRPLDLRFNN